MNIFITGVSSGIGRELTKQLVAEGHRVWGVARRETLLHNLQQEIGSERFSYSICDVSKHDQVNQVVSQMVNSGAIPDVVILNAAILKEDCNKTFEYDIARTVIDTNLYGVMNWIELLLSVFLQRKSGTFVLISSTASKRPIIESVSLSASKAAASMLFRGLRLRYYHEGVSFKIIYLGPVATDISPDYKKRANEGLMSLLVATPRSIAKKIAKQIKKNKNNVYIPWLSTSIFRILMIIPDVWFSYISRRAKKRT